MTKAFVFDVYGTLIDPTGIVKKLETIFGEEDAKKFSELWRTTQISYSFRRSMLGLSSPFTQCTLDALNYCSDLLDMPLSKSEQDQLMASYRALPPFPDVDQTLIRLRQQQINLYAFSNGAKEDLIALFDHADLRRHFADLISVETTGHFKPDPKVYHYLRNQVQEDVGDIIFVSANPFDVQGATNVGFQSIWVKRARESVFDPWGPQPKWIVSALGELIGIHEN